jgi:glycosyltransferase involved in cell wall biosynthesis
MEIRTHVSQVGKNPLFSICITHYNNAKTVRSALNSLFSQIDDNFEVILVDNESDDGSKEILEEFRDNNNLKLISTKCTRGRGRQIAFEASLGEYIISNIDMDDILKAGAIKHMLDFYFQKCNDSLLWIRNETQDSWGSVVMISPRWLLEKLGGWRDVNVLEDRSLAARASKVGKYRWTCMNLFSFITKKSGRSNLKNRFEYYLCLKQLGGKVKEKRFYHRLISAVITIYFLLRVSKRLARYDDLANDFNEQDKRFFISQGGTLS